MVSVATGPAMSSRQCWYWAGSVRKSTWGSGVSLVMVDQPSGPGYALPMFYVRRSYRQVSVACQLARPARDHRTGSRPARPASADVVEALPVEPGVGGPALPPV